MATPIPWSPRGVLHAHAVEGPCRVWRFAPRQELTDVLAHVWAVGWDLRGHAPVTRETLPHPTVHVVLERGRSCVRGVATARFTRSLEGRGFVLGLKFHPGGFRPFLGRPVAHLTDRLVPLREGLGEGAEQLERHVLERLDADDPRAAAECAEAFLLERLPAPDPRAGRARRIVARIRADPHQLRVQDVADAAGMGLRTLQRLFREYVGVSPKWVLQRYRLHEAVARLDAGEPLDLAALALALGFADQPHFTRAFRELVGCTPWAYARASAHAT